MPELTYLSWDEYFMGIAIFTSLRSKDPSSKVGAVIVNAQNHIVGTGYNGFIAGVDENRFSWEREGEWIHTKYPYVVHAEANAILSSTTEDLRDCRIYTTLFPCNECAKHIAQKKIKEVIYLSDKYRGEAFHQASEIIFEAAGATVRKLKMPPLAELLQRFEGFIP
ncbi:MAG: dCMP deaminase family protein [Calditrichaceae bacterium]|nr:dCMP deaminase family protein [Calditrichia bacterium]NUQ42765.1 dCMP deaminase family protein [Calditrichaceae bacterium]